MGRKICFGLLIGCVVLASFGLAAAKKKSKTSNSAKKSERFFQAIIQQSDNERCFTAQRDKNVSVRRCADLFFGKKGGWAQRWSYTKNQQLKTKESNKCMVPKKAKAKAKGELKLTKCSKKPAQQWILDQGLIRHKNSGLCINGFEGKLVEDRKVELAKCNRKKKSQIWKVYGQKVGNLKWAKKCTVPNNVELNNARFVRAHNAYETKHYKRFSTAIKGRNIVEIDLTPKGILSTSKRKLYVSHALGKHENNCGKNGNGDFKTCLGDLKSYHDKNKNHPLKVVVINLKFSPDLNPNKFMGPKNVGEYWMKRIDNAVFSVLGKENLYRPKDRKGKYKHLRQALNKSAWPTLGSLRGKFMVTLNAGPALQVKGAGQVDANYFLNNYLTKRGYKAAAFTCPFPRDSDDLIGSKNWKHLSPANTNHLACITLQYDRKKGLNGVLKKKAAKQRSQKMIMDVWNPVGVSESFIKSPCLTKGSACPDDPRGFRHLVKTGATVIGTNFPQSIPWATDGPRGKQGCKF